MANTSLNFWLTAVGMVAAMALIVVTIGVDLRDAGANLDQDSLIYINNTQSAYTTNNFDEISDEDAAALEGDNPMLDGNDTGGFLDFEQLAVVKFVIDKTQAVASFLKFMYNIPSFILGAFNLPVGGLLGGIVNIIGVIISITIIVMLLRLIK